MDTSQRPVWLVTGCSSGLGHALARQLLLDGYRVIVTAREPSSVSDLAELGDALVLALDVCDADQVEAAVAHAEAHFGRIDVLVNNAGIGYFAAVEESDPAQVRRLFEVNYFGLTRMIGAVLPGMRARRSGWLVNVTSIGGLCGFPAVGHYCASKFAVEGLSEALAQELAPLGIGVTLVEPSAFRTEWAVSATAVAEPMADYDATAGAAIRAYRDSPGKQAGDPVRAARAIIATLASPRPPLRLLLGNRAFDTAMAVFACQREEFAAWEDSSRGADYPQEAA
ncbi:Short-chain dehydrogenase [Azotobacter beijerinckii]|uniref:Short-chain dehydrogenase n=1 Tax=Azotobacter beijerinckii TaxID=170623 RepID=A0A1H6Y5W2_9GAMM|nr:oxidoreductase [Azotobacter beijerinckii]SEJ35846.1 Short-chain dehydrogenase [Azotobacter beijerinckii]SEJ49113.1 Short-chain dehydrogenase [Azotobacter beijerinckii]